MAFDLDALETRGTAVPVLDDVAAKPSSAPASFDVSTTGTLVYRRAGVGRPMRVKLVDGSGTRTSLLSACM